MVSMKDISSRCHVSVATVSKALNNRGDISDETKERICQVAKELGYLPNSSARALKTNRTYNIGVLFVDKANCGLTHSYFSHVLDSFRRGAEEEGYDITFISQHAGKNKLSYYEHSKYRGVDGVVIACVDFEDEADVYIVNTCTVTAVSDKKSRQMIVRRRLYPLVHFLPFPSFSFYHSRSTFPSGHRDAAERSFYARHKKSRRGPARSAAAWLGRPDLNRRLAESKSAALPLGYIPSSCPSLKQLNHYSTPFREMQYLFMFVYKAFTMY